MLFAKRLRTLREDADLTQEDLGEKIGVSARVVGYYESGDRFPKSEETLKRIAVALKTSVDFLLGLTDEQLAGFLPAEVIRQHKIEAWVGDAELSKQTKTEIKQLLRKHGYLK